MGFSGRIAEFHSTNYLHISMILRYDISHKLSLVEFEVCTRYPCPLSLDAVEAGFKLLLLPSQPPKDHGYNSAPSYLAAFWIFNQCDLLFHLKFSVSLIQNLVWLQLEERKIHFNLNLSSPLKFLQGLSYRIISETNLYFPLPWIPFSKTHMYSVTHATYNVKK